MRIKDISEEERPRERLLKHGPKTLSNAELLAIILRTGNKKENVMELTHKLLQKYHLKSLSRISISTITKLSGIGEAKACQIVACFELGRRLAAFNKERKIKINSAKEIAKMFMPEMSTLKKEHLVSVYLDTRMRIIKEEITFVGSLNTSVTHPREIFQPAISEGAVAVILIHNHPSGDPNPSEEDIETTKQLAAAGKIMGIEILDHVIIGDKKYYSLRDKGHFQVNEFSD